MEVQLLSENHPTTGWIPQVFHRGRWQCRLQADAGHPSIRLCLRSKAIVLMDKNTMMRKAIRGHLENNPSLERLLPHIRGNVGFIFTKEDLAEVRDLLLANKEPAAAHAGAIAPCEVTVPAQNTGLGPEKTSFFQALGITTKISRGTIEILSDIQLIKPGDKVGTSEATLLNMLNISPFSYGLIIQQVYDNCSVYSPEVLDITEKALDKRFLESVRNIASVCLQIGYPMFASIQTTPSPWLRRWRSSWLIPVLSLLLLLLLRLWRLNLQLLRLKWRRPRSSPRRLMRTWATACLIKLLNEYPCQININKTSGNIKKKNIYIYIYIYIN